MYDTRLYPDPDKPPSFYSDTDELVKCDGKIYASVSLIEEPYFGGTDPALDAGYHCTKCGTPIIPDGMPSMSHALVQALEKYLNAELENKP